MAAQAKTQPKRNLTAWVPKPYFDKIKAFIKKENEKPENKDRGIKLKLREFIIKSIDEYMTKRGG